MLIFLSSAALLLGMLFLLLGKLPEQPYNAVTAPPSQKDTLKVLLFYHAADYFIYKGAFIGFQYELFHIMEKELKKKVEVTVENDPQACFYHYFSGKYDIVAFDCDPQDVALHFLTFSYPHSTTCPVLVVNRNDTVSSRDIHISAPFNTKVNEKSFSNFADCNFIYDRNKTAEILFDELDRKQIQAIVTYYNDALMLLAFYPNLRIAERINDTLKRRWCLNPVNRTLNDTLNNWLAEFTQTNRYKLLCNKYLSHNSAILRQASQTQKKYDISPYDKIIRHYAREHRLDWLFVASVMYQESKFITGLTGIGGSFGLMQMMPLTGQRYGVNEYSSPEAQIRAGVRHLAELRRKYSDFTEKELLHVVAGAYNAGSGHIQDAFELCRKYGEDYTCWNNVAKYLISLSQSKYANDSIVRCGYYPGVHTVRYVRDIMARYEGYKKMNRR